MNYKKVINIILRCGLYVYIMSRISNPFPEINIFFFISVIKCLIDLFLLNITFGINDINGTMFENNVIIFNFLLFAYFYAKICGIYKLFKECLFWKKFLIFILLSFLIFPITLFDFKNFKLYDSYFENYRYRIILIASIFVILAFILNLIFEFLTKKFPKPFEKIGYWVSIEFYKNLFKKLFKKHEK